MIPHDHVVLILDVVAVPIQDDFVVVRYSFLFVLRRKFYFTLILYWPSCFQRSN